MFCAWLRLPVLQKEEEGNLWQNTIYQVLGLGLGLEDALFDFVEILLAAVTGDFVEILWAGRTEDFVEILLGEELKISKKYFWQEELVIS